MAVGQDWGKYRQKEAPGVGGGREHRDMRGLGLQDATGPTC